MVTTAFITASALLLITPGPTNTMLATCGATLRLREAALMPFAEAIGYLLAISFFVAIADLAKANALVLAGMKLAAAAWLIHTALRLWKTPFATARLAPHRSFLRVLATTILNPKAMIVGTLFIPSLPLSTALAWIGTYGLLSIVAGFGWVLLGSLLPLPVRRHSYKGAAVVLTGFSIAAIISSIA